MPADPAATARSAQRLAAALPQRLSVWHSPLQRCELLAHDLIGLRPDLTLKPAAELVEFDFGRWEGRAWSAIARTQIDAWAADLAGHAPGGGEPLAALLERVALALRDAAARAHDQGADMVWISHAGVARCVQWLQQHGPGRAPQAHEWPLQAPDFGAWVSVALPTQGWA